MKNEDLGDEAVYTYKGILGMMYASMIMTLKTFKIEGKECDKFLRVWQQNYLTQLKEYEKERKQNEK